MQRRLLATLLAQEGRPVRVDELIDALWRGTPPRSARKSLQIYVHRLRVALGMDERIRYDRNGYWLEVAEAEVDATRFVGLVTQARAAQCRGDLVGASTLYRVALELWQDAAYADVADIPAAVREAQRLEEWRLQAWEDRCDVDLTLGRRDGMIAGLNLLIAAHPFRERLRALLMMALYGSERQAEALQVFRDTRALFVSELGIEPGARLHALNAWILGRETMPFVLASAPSSLLDFTGRADELHWLSRRLGYSDIRRGSSPGNNR